MIYILINAYLFSHNSQYIVCLLSKYERCYESYWNINVMSEQFQYNISGVLKAYVKQCLVSYTLSY